MPDTHHTATMSGRDRLEPHRVATPLELLFDLTLVVAFGVAGSEVATLFAKEHWLPGIAGFSFAMFGTIWAWINFSWFASAFDTDDWKYRILTMIQMLGVVILTIGLPDMFDSIDAGKSVDNRTMVAGYVVMRVAMVALWLRAVREAPRYRATCLSYARSIAIAQVGWILLALFQLSTATMLALALALGLLEMTGPLRAERRLGSTPWHPHHIAERYGLLAIIALGEGIVGTVATLSALVELNDGWRVDAAAIGFAGVAITFGMWWTYFLVPSGEVLGAHPERSFAWGYGHLLIFGSIAATGAGIHVAGYFVEGEKPIGAAATVATIAVPIGIFVAGIFWIYSTLTRSADAFHIPILTVIAAILVLAVVLAAAGVPLGICLLILVLAPAAAVIGYELHAHKAMREVLTRQ